MAASSAATYRAVRVSSLAKTFDEAIASLSIVSLPRQPLGDSDVRVRVRASALNYFDLLQLVGRYQHKPDLPFTPGSELAGDVIEVGRLVQSHRVGDPVVVGMGGGSSMAEERVVHSALCMPKPSSMSYKEAAGVAVGFLTAYHGLVHRGKLSAGEVLLVTGAGGGMGLAAVQVGAALGAKVIAAASSEDKLDAARRAGATVCIHTGNQDLKTAVSEATGGAMADVIYEVVGGAIFKECLRCTGANGRLLVIGFASGEIPSVPANVPLIKGFSVVGVRAGAALALDPNLALDANTALITLGNEGKITPYVGFTFGSTLQGVQKAFECLARREAIGKVVITWDREEEGGHSTTGVPQLKSRL